MLNENGVVLTNIIASIEGEDSDFIKYEYTTYRQKLILVGFKGNPERNETKYPEYWQYLDMEVIEFETDKQIVTDDFAPIGN